MSPILESSGEDAHGLATGEPEDELFPIHSDDAYVAIASVACRSCFHRFDAICIFCPSGTAFEEELDNFTVANVHGVDESLAKQLALWPTYRWLGSTMILAIWRITVRPVGSHTTTKCCATSRRIVL